MISLMKTITVYDGDSAMWIGWPVVSASASVIGTVRIPVDSDAPSAMLTTGCIRFASAARIAVTFRQQADQRNAACHETDRHRRHSGGV